MFLLAPLAILVAVAAAVGVLGAKSVVDEMATCDPCRRRPEKTPPPGGKIPS